MEDSKPDYSKYFPRAESPVIDKASLEKLYPKQLNLEQLIIIHRHGDRTPLTPRFPSLFPTEWKFCGNSNNLEFAPMEPSHSGRGMAYHKVMENVNGHANIYEPKVPNPEQFSLSTCGYGQLTDIGRETLYNHGSHIRSIYVDHLKFLPKDMAQIDPRQIYFRTTDYPRTLESMQHLMLGLYPSLPLKDLVIRTRTHRDETMFMDYKCDRLVQLRQNLDDALKPSLKNEWDSFRKQIASTELNSYISTKEFDHVTAIHKLYDTVSSAVAHGLPLPKGYTPEHHLQLDALELKLWLNSFHTPEFSKLGIGRLYTDVAYHMSSALPTSKDYFKKLVIFSGHDTTVGPFLIGLGALGSKWPPYGAIIMMELFKDTTSQSSTTHQHSSHSRLFDEPSSKDLTPVPTDRYVRVKYNDQILTLPQCQPEANHHPTLGPSFCKLKTVMELFDHLAPKQFKKECNGFQDEISDR